MVKQHPAELLPHREPGYRGPLSSSLSLSLCLSLSEEEEEEEDAGDDEEGPLSDGALVAMANRRPGCLFVARPFVFVQF
jgi:hypothetical protein